MQELVVESLVVSLAMVVFSVLVDETTQMPLAERDHACETLLCDRPDEPLGIGVEIGTLRRQPNRLNTGALQDLAKDPRIEGIAVVNQMAPLRKQPSTGSVKLRACCSIHAPPGCGWIPARVTRRDLSSITKKTRYPPEPRQRQHLDGEQIAGRQCSAPGFLDSGLTVFASMLPRPTRRSHVAPERGFDSGTSLASTARCTSA